MTVVFLLRARDAVRLCARALHCASFAVAQNLGRF
jgi:hypothetical protein